MVKKVIVLTLIIFLCTASIAFGYVMGSSNLGISGYPEFTSKHIRPFKPYHVDSRSIREYSYEVEIYVMDAQNYIKAAENDIDRIQEEIDKATNEANITIREHNSFIESLK